MRKFTLVTSGKAVKRLRKAYALAGTPWPRGVKVVALPGNPTGNTMLVGGRSVVVMAGALGGTLGVL